MSIPISVGSGAASVAAEAVAGLQYQRVEILGQGGSSVMAVNPDGSVNVSVIGAINVTGSIIAAGNQSVSGAINVSGSVVLGSSNASVITVWQDSSVLAVPVGSVITVFKSSSIIAIAAGSVVAIPVGSVITVFQSSSLIAVVTGSVATVFQGSVLTIPTSSTITVWRDSSVLAVPVGSTLTVWDKSPSIVGTYAEDAASATGDKGFLVMGARNDTLASVTSADGDYSSHVVGPSGELIAENAPLTKWVQGTADFRQGNAGASIIVIASGGSSVFTYITGVQVANLGSASVLVTLASGGSTLGYTIAPAGGGSNIYYENALKTPGNFGFAASTSGIASVLVSAQGFVSKT